MGQQGQFLKLHLFFRFNLQTASSLPSFLSVRATYREQKLKCKRFEPRSHFKSRLSLIVRVNVVLNRTVVVDSDRRFDNLCGSHLQSQTADKYLEEPMKNGFERPLRERDLA